MPESPLVTAGAEIPPSAAAPLHTNEFFTGMWTQGNPLGAGAVPYLYQKFYSASRYDRMLGGQNVEVSSKLTMTKRPGLSVYNSSLIPRVNRFYRFPIFQNNAEVIKVMASCDPFTGGTQGTVREVTGPAVNNVLFLKSAAAGKTGFQAVGNILYMGDGQNPKKWIQSGQTWQPATLEQPNSFIVDTNGNLQVAMGAQTATITNIQVVTVHPSGAPPYKVVTLWFSAATPVNLLDNIALTLAGLTTVPSLNGVGPYTTVILSPTQVQMIGVFTGVPNTSFSVETGTASTGNGTTGAVQPVWNINFEIATQDGGNQWINLGPALQNWGFPAPANAPIVSQAPAPTVYPNWAANTWYAPLFVILDSNSNLQQLTTAGTTGGSAPVWNVTVGGTTADNTAVWTNLGPGTWTANHAYAAGALILATYTYYITVPQVTEVFNGYTYVPTVTFVPQPVTVTSLFQCATGGVSNPTTVPNWINGLGTYTNDGSVVWKNLGTAPAWPGAAQVLSLATTIVDANGNLQTPQVLGETGGTAPTWLKPTGSTTVDHNQNWLNQGPFSAANTAAWVWAYSGMNSVTGHIGTASPLSQPLIVAAGQLAVIQGVGPTDPQEDVIVLWRTVQGGSTLLYDGQFPNPGANQPWVYTDTVQDPSSTNASNPNQLNPLITAPINGANNPPPAGFVPQCFYLGRIWGFVGNQLVYSGGPATITGSGNEAFPALNQFTFPSSGVKCWATSIGLIAYTLSDVWVVLGQGTTSSPFYVINFQQGVGLANPDAFDVNGSTAYGMLTSGQVVSMDPGAGEVEVGFPIGDQFNTLYNYGSTYCAWHQAASGDMALYVADDALGWFRMAPVAAPESGNVWSNRALITGGLSAIASIETSPGLKQLLVGPGPTAGGPILFRDTTTHADNGVSYDSHADIGSVVLAQPGNTVAVQFITTEEIAIANMQPAYVAVLLNEIAGVFSTLRQKSNDPPNLPPSTSVTANRWWVAQDPKTGQKCRHMLVRIGWVAQNAANELLTYTIYGRLPEKARK